MNPQSPQYGTLNATTRGNRVIRTRTAQLKVEFYRSTKYRYGPLSDLPYEFGATLDIAHAGRAVYSEHYAQFVIEQDDIATDVAHRA